MLAELERQRKELTARQHEFGLFNLAQATNSVLGEIQEASDKIALRALPGIRTLVGRRVRSYKELSGGAHPGPFKIEETERTFLLFDFARKVNGVGIIRGPVEMWAFDDGVISMQFVKAHGEFVERMNLQLEAWPRGYIIAAREVADFLSRVNPLI